MMVLKNSLVGGGLATIKTDIWALGLEQRNMIMLVMGTVVLFISSVLRAVGDQGNKTLLVEWITRKNFVIRYALYWACMIMIIFSMDITGQEFIYFQF